MPTPPTSTPWVPMWPLSNPPATFGIAFPGSPVDGQEFTLVDSLTAPTYAWTFRYVASISDAYKWVLTGGSPVINEVATAEATSSTGYTDLTTIGPQFTVPRAGIYEITLSFNQYGNNIPGGAAVKLGAASTAVTEGLNTGAGANGAGAGNSISATSRVGGSRTFKRTLAASDVLVMRYKIEAGGGSNTFCDRSLRVLPLRLS